MTKKLIKIKRAIISLSNKENSKKLSDILLKYKIEVLSTGGTAKILTKHKLKTTEVSDYTNFPEIMEGRVKTLHPKIHGGILARDQIKKHKQTMNLHNIKKIDLVVVNLYPFQEISVKNNSFNECIENIDIGGPAMIRSAAKNNESVVVVTDPKDYTKLENILEKNNGSTTLDFRKQLAAKAFGYTAYYDSIIQQWFNSKLKIDWPEKFTISANLKSLLRYGENPHQKSALYSFPDNNNTNNIVNSKIIQGKPLSYNNFNDGNAAIDIVNDFNKPTLAIIKHSNPCGVSTGTNSIKIWKSALRTDPISAFGGVVAFNREIDDILAKEMNKLFLEVIICPKFTTKALKIFSTKKNLRLLEIGKLINKKNNIKDIRQISHGLLLQDKNDITINKRNLKIVTKRKPTPKEKRDLLFAFKIAKHVKSNAIIYAKNQTTVGIGAGQMSRVDSTKIAANKAREASSLAKLSKNLTYGSVVASDAFFPFDDGLIAAAEAGVTAVIQPGGSVRDNEVIEAADKLSISMIFTGIRHFKH